MFISSTIFCDKIEKLFFFINKIGGHLTNFTKLAPGTHQLSKIKGSIFTMKNQPNFLKISKTSLIEMLIQYG
jgi:hypothetical protein